MKNISIASNEISFGCFSTTELAQYQSVHQLSNDDIRLLSQHRELDKDQLERVCGVQMTDRIYYLIKEFDLSAGALLLEDMDWELVALCSQERPFNYYQKIVNLMTDEQFLNVLETEEKHHLAIIINFLQIQLKRENFEYKLNLSFFNEKNKKFLK